MPAHRLGPHIVGQRVVLRHVVAGERGPTGGPAFTDLLGELVAWPAGDDPRGPRALVALRDADGIVHEVPVGLVVSGKPVPPRPAVRARLAPEDLQHAAARSWPAATVEHLGEWLLRDDVDVDPVTAGVRRVGRLTSALAVGDPGVPLTEAVAAVTAWYVARDRRPWASTLLDSDADAAFVDLGWSAARDGEPATETWVGSVAAASRRLGDPDDSSPATGRLVTDPRDPDTVGVVGLATPADLRGRGHARARLAQLVETAAEQGARTLWVQVLGDNHAAQGLFEQALLAPHHRARYLRAP